MRVILQMANCNVSSIVENIWGKKYAEISRIIMPQICGKKSAEYRHTVFFANDNSFIPESVLLEDGQKQTVQHARLHRAKRRKTG